MEFFDTLRHKNDTLYVSYSYYGSTAPLEYNLPLRVFNWNYGYTEVAFPPDTIVGVLVHSDSSVVGWDNDYNVEVAVDSLLPENYGFYGGENPSSSIEETLTVWIGEFDVFLAGTLLSVGGGIAEEDFQLQIRQTDAPYGQYNIFSEDGSGTYQIGLFHDTGYEFSLHGDLEDFMTPPPLRRSFSPGDHTLNFSLYPLDDSYWLYLEIDSDDPMDDSLSATLFSPDSQHSSIHNFGTNRWAEMPIYSGFSDSCKLWIRNKKSTATWWFEPLTRIIENNGNITVMPGDSIYLTAELPIDEFIMEFQRDTADSWQYPIGPGEFEIQYFDPEDTSLVYTYYVPNHTGNSRVLPIFEEQLLVGIETPYNFDRHHFIANPDDYLRVGGPYRPDRVEKYMNSGSGEMLLTLDGYPADYLGDDTVWFDQGDFSGVETPDFPGHHFIADLFLFRTRPTMHPWGDASVMAFHDVCDGEWTVRLPDSLPGGFVPTVTETSFYCTDIDSYPEQWQEFPITIPVGSPDGVHGWINREMRFFEASESRIDYYSLSTDSLIATKYAWQYQPWGDLSMYAKYFIKETELPPGDYYVEISYLDWPEEKTFIYPGRIEFTYSGDSLLLPDAYIGMVKGNAHIRIDGLDSVFHEDARLHLLPYPDSIPSGTGFYEIDAEYSFPEPGDTTTLKIPSGSWIIRPVAPFGLFASPPETVLHVPTLSDSITEYDIFFDYEDVSISSRIEGNLVRDTLDPLPVNFDTLIVRLIGYGDTLAIYETEPDDSGYFAFDSVLAPSNMRIDIRYDGGSELFYSQPGEYYTIDAAETLDVGEIFVDNANATVNVAFHGLDFDQLSTISWTQFIPLDGYMLGDTFNLPYPSGETRNTFKLCDGEWKVFPQKVLGVDFVPRDTVFSIDESYSTYNVTFVYPASIGESKLPLEFDFSAYPNPFNDVVVFEIALPEDSPVKLGVYDLSGRRVTEIERNYEAGIHRILWNGKGEGNRELSSGIYLYRVETGKKTRTIKGVYLK